MDLGWEIPEEREENKYNQQYITINFCNFTEYLLLLITQHPLLIMFHSTVLTSMHGEQSALCPGVKHLHAL